MQPCYRRDSAASKAVPIVLISILTLTLAGSAGAQLSFTEQTMPSDFGTNLFAAPHDLDEDGWMDMLVTDRDNDIIIWFRNDGGTGFEELPIPDTGGYLTYPYVDDLDEDGDWDIIGATYASFEAAWWENDGSENFTRHLIGDMTGGHWAKSVDLDDDGDLDIVVCGLENGGNKWFENDGNENFSEHVISPGRSSHCVDWADFDDDGDLDLVTTDINAGVIVWKNDGSENFTPTTHIFLWAHWVIVDDIDLDGDPDFAAVSFNPSEVAWWENDGAGTFAKHSVSTSFLGPLVVDTGDLDEDGDIDIAASAINSHEVSWWENDGSQGFTEHALTGHTYTNATSVQIADLDGDSDADLVCTGQVSPCVRWYESDIVDIVLTTDVTTGVAPFDVSLSESSTSRYPITERLWDCDYDGEMDATGSSTVWTYDTPGTHSVLLEVWMGTRVGRALLTDRVTAFDTGSALWFDGDGGHIDCPSSPSAELSGPFTVEAWINPYDWGGFPMGSYGFGHILEKDAVSLLLIGTHPVRNDHSLYVELVHGDATVSGACSPIESIELDEWQHVAVTYDGVSDVRMWIDGAEQTVTYTVVPTGNLGANGAVTIGNISGLLNRTFEGTIDDVRLWNTDRGEPDILATKDCVLSGDEPGLVGYWALDDGNGGTAVDGSVAGSDGAITGALWTQGVVLYPTSVPGETGDDDVWASVKPHLVMAPNPFERSTAIALTLPRPGNVLVTVHDLAGRVVTKITNAYLDAGVHTFEWNGRNSEGSRAATGVYFCRAASEDGVAAGKMVLLR